MNSKQLKAQRRRANQKLKKSSHSDSRGLRSAIHRDNKIIDNDQSDPISFIQSQSLLLREIEFDQLTLGPCGVFLKPMQGVIIKVEVTDSNINSSDAVLTISFLNAKPSKNINKRSQALLGLDSDILRILRSELINLRFIN